jgi:hypothetical protein
VAKGLTLKHEQRTHHGLTEEKYVVQALACRAAKSLTLKHEQPTHQGLTEEKYVVQASACRAAKSLTLKREQRTHHGLTEEKYVVQASACRNEPQHPAGYQRIPSAKRLLPESSHACALTPPSPCSDE